MGRARTILIGIIISFLLYLVSRRSLSDAARLEHRERRQQAKQAPPGLLVQDRPVAQPSFRSDQFRKRIVAVGDIHGDLDHLRRILRFANIVDSDGSWIGGAAELVQTGDIVDRGTDTIALYRYFQTLRDEARLAGGQVHSLLGNHEIMNAMGDWRYVTSEDIATFGGAEKRREAMSIRGWIGEEWRANYSITARVPFHHQDEDFSSISFPSRHFSHSAAAFVHGGILPSYIDSLPIGPNSPIERINAIGSSFMAILDPAPGPTDRSRWTALHRDFWSERGPMWDRTSALGEEEEVCRLSKLACDELGVKRIVMGHTPTFEKMVSRCDGRVLLIDTGISRAYGGVLSALEISIELNRTAGTDEWIEQEVVSALYEKDTKVLARVRRTFDWTGA